MMILRGPIELHVPISIVLECKGLGARLKISKGKACGLLPTTVVYMHIYGNRNHMDLCSQGSANLCMSGNLLDDLMIFYQAFGVTMSFNRCGTCMFVDGGGLNVY